MIDSPHGQEKTSTQKEIREEVGTLDKEINQPEEERDKENRAKKEARAPQEESASRTPAEVYNPIVSPSRRGLGPGAGGQSGDNQGLSRREVADSESVEELTEEGQEYEAEVVSGVENARDPDQGEVTTREVPEDDVPSEYDDQDQ